VIRLFALMLILAFTTACGGSEEKPKTSPGAAAEEEEEAGGAGMREVYSPDKGSATVTGTVKWEGTAPKRREIDMSADKYCANCYAEGEVPVSETAIVAEDGSMANVFIYLKGDGLKGWKFPDGTATRVLDQVNCHYTPHVLGAQKGDALHVKNSDGTMHNIHATPMEGGDDLFNQGQPNKGDVYKTTVDTAGFVRVKCDVHGWMGAFICVVSHPFFAVTGEDGKFSIANVPAGDYTVVAWHEKYGEQEMNVSVKDGEAKSTSFTFSK